MRFIHSVAILAIICIMLQIPISNGSPDDDEICYIDGYVFEAYSDGKPIIFAWISVYDNNTLINKGLSGRNGSYSFTIKSGMYNVYVEKAGFITRNAFVILEPQSSLRIDFYLEKTQTPYEVSIFVTGIPENIYPEMLIDNNFSGHIINGTKIRFMENSTHIIVLNQFVNGSVRYVPSEEGPHIFTETETIVFPYHIQYYVTSNTNQWINDWYDEGTIHLEASETVDLGNSTRLLFDAWLKDGKTIRQNPIMLDVNSSFHLDTKYRKQFYLNLSSEMSTAKGSGYYDEDSIAEISVEEVTVGSLPFAYRFSRWRGDIESQNATEFLLMDGPKQIHAEWESVEVVQIEKLDPIYKAIINISLLVFAAKIFSGLFARVKLPEVLGELAAGMILGPYALGGIIILGEPLMELNEYVQVFAEVGAILLLFIAGLEVSFGQFRAVGAKSSVVGVFGVIVPFLLGIYLLQFLGFDWNVNLLIAATLTATSIAITVRTLEDIGKLNSEEGSIMINSAVIDDVLSLVVLAVILSIVTSGVVPLPSEIAWILFRTLAFWLLLMAIVLTIAPRLITRAERWKARGTVEVVATATCFGSAVAATTIGLSPIVGAFAAGMAIASSRMLARVRDYIEKLSILFSPIFFAYIGAQFNINALSFESLLLIITLVTIAVISKLLGCGLPAMIALRNLKSGFRVGIGMISRGEVGLIIAGIGVTSGILTQNIYGAVVAMVIFTTIVTPIALRWAYTEKKLDT
ncbi:cation:proton antiporter domain-containing protein [[Eubacterium] cellulosolvens]